MELDTFETMNRTIHDAGTTIIMTVFWCVHTQIIVMVGHNESKLIHPACFK